MSGRRGIKAFVLLFSVAVVAVLILHDSSNNVWPSPDTLGRSRGSPSLKDGYAVDSVVSVPWYQRNISKAYFTLISSPEYDIGAQILVCRLRLFSPNITIIVFVDESVKLHSTSYYENMGVSLVRVSNPIQNVNSTAETRSGTYTKLQIWNVTNVDVAVYIDADAIPVRNPESLFSELSPREDLGVVGWKSPDYYFNSGVMVFRPSMDTYNKLIQRLKNNEYAKQRDPTEQDLLVSHFGLLNETKLIDDKYNYRPLHNQHGLNNAAVIVHWIGNPKPWTAILGKETTIEGLKSTRASAHLPLWSLRLFECEMERFFSFCHDQKSAQMQESGAFCV